MSTSYGPSYRSVDLHIGLTFSIFSRAIPRPLEGLYGLVWSIGGLIQTKTNNFSATFLSNSIYKFVRCNTVRLTLRERELPSIIVEAKGLSVREWGKFLQTRRSNIPSFRSSNWGHGNTEAKLPYHYKYGQGSANIEEQTNTKTQIIHSLYLQVYLKSRAHKRDMLLN